MAKGLRRLLKRYELEEVADRLFSKMSIDSVEKFKRLSTREFQQCGLRPAQIQKLKRIQEESVGEAGEDARPQLLMLMAVMTDGFNLKKQERTRLILDKFRIQRPIELDGSDPKNHKSRDFFFQLSDQGVKYPQLFAKHPDDTYEFLATGSEVDDMNEKDELYHKLMEEDSGFFEKHPEVLVMEEVFRDFLLESSSESDVEEIATGPADVSAEARQLAAPGTRVPQQAPAAPAGRISLRGARRRSSVQSERPRRSTRQEALARVGSI